MDEKPNTKLPTVSRVLSDGRIVELLYDRENGTTAFVVADVDNISIVDSVDVGGETLVPFSPQNNLIKHGVVMLPSAVESYGSVNELITDISAYLARYLDLSPEFTTLTPYYILLSWVYDAFQEVPYIRFRGDLGSGKTRALLVIGSLTYKGFFASGASTVSPIFHTLDAFRGTLILDEADFRFSDEQSELVKILNNGNVRGFPVLRTMMNHKKEFDPRAFTVFGPKLIAMRHSFEDEALESRFVTEEMGLRPIPPSIPINLPDAQQEEALYLRNKLLSYRFVNLHSSAIKQTIFHDSSSLRTKQIATPLLSIVENEEHRNQLLTLFGQTEASVTGRRSLRPEAALLSVLLKLSENEKLLLIALTDIAHELEEIVGGDIDRVITPRYVGILLRSKLNLTTVRRHGSYFWPTMERTRALMLATRYGVGDMGDLGDFKTDHAVSE
jgi:hypothetical protein